MADDATPHSDADPLRADPVGDPVAVPHAATPPTPPPLPTQRSASYQPTRIPGSYDPSQQPVTWPKTFGIISLTLAIAALVYTPWTTWENLHGGFDDGFVGEDILAQFPAWYRTWSWIAAGIGMSEALFLLLPAAILLIKRRRLSVSLHRVYAVIAILTTLVATIATLVGLEEARESMEPWLVDSFQVGLFSGTMIGLAYPVILLWWFWRATVKKDIAEWES